MKKIFILSLLLSISSVLVAEDMRFVTLLSRPVGSFARVDLANSTQPAQITGTLNFCTATTLEGAISAADVDITKLYVTADGGLGGNAPQFLITNSIYIGENASFTGGSLHWTGTADASHVLVANNGKDAELNSESSITSKVGALNTMTVKNTAVFDTPASAQIAASSLSWRKVTTTTADTSSISYPKALLLTNWIEKEEPEDPCEENPSTENCCTSAEISAGKTWHSTLEVCVCPSSKPNYNSTTGVCEAIATEEETSTYTCYTSWVGKNLTPTNDLGVNSDTLLTTGHWRNVSYRTDMVCGNETVHHGGYITSLSKGAEVDCTPGEYYLWYDTYGYCGDDGIGDKTQICTKYWYACVKCGTTDSLSKCGNFTIGNPNNGNTDGGFLDFELSTDREVYVP